MPPIIALVGRGNSGKTTLLIKIATELTKRNFRIASVKHTFHNLEFDKPGTDSWHHIQAGSKATVLSTQNVIFMIKPIDKNYGINNIIELLGEEYDLIIVEGYKKSDIPKIEVHRSVSGPLLSGIKNIVAIATDEPLNTVIQQFSLNDIQSISDYIIKNCIITDNQRYSIYINNRPITKVKINFKSFEKAISILVSNIKGINVKEIRDLKIFYKRQIS